MNINTLRQFRYDIYDCFERAKDGLFNTVDALMTEADAKSLPEVTQSLWFERHWSSIYEAFKDGKIDQQYLQKIFTRSMPSGAGCPSGRTRLASLGKQAASGILATGASRDE